MYKEQHDKLSDISEEESEMEVLSEQFFTALHDMEMRYVRLKFRQKSKSNQEELIEIIVDLVRKYADCINYFERMGENVTIYYQAKVKQLSKYYSQLMSVIIMPKQHEVSHLQIPIGSQNQIESEKNTSRSDRNANQQEPTHKVLRQQLGSLRKNSMLEIFQVGDQLGNVNLKENLNKNVMVYLQIQNQDIKDHIGDGIKKAQNIQNTIQNNLKEQDDLLQIRRKQKVHRQMLKSKSQSFSFSSISTISPEKHKNNVKIREFHVQGTSSERNENQDQIILNKEQLFANDIDSEEEITMKDDENCTLRVHKPKQREQNYSGRKSADFNRQLLNGIKQEIHFEEESPNDFN